MDDLAINTDYLGSLILKVRALMAREGPVDPEFGDNPTDDEGPAVLQETPDDLSREEIIEEINGLNAEQQAQLVALLWLGRGDGNPDDWERLNALAAERAETPTAEYLLEHPLVAEYWADGLEKLGRSSSPGLTPIT